jgi:hypothetical protein
LIPLALLSTASAAPEVVVGYHGDLLAHPGVVGRGAVRRGPLALEGQGLAYWHPQLMTAVQLRAGPAVRLTGPRGGVYGLFAHGGVQRGFWTAPTYTASGDRLHFAGDTWAIVATGLELGHSVRTGPIHAWTVHGPDRAGGGDGGGATGGDAHRARRRRPLPHGRRPGRLRRRGPRAALPASGG